MFPQDNIRAGLGTGVQYPTYNTGRRGSTDQIDKLVKDLQQWNKPLPSNPNSVNTSQVQIGGINGGVKPSSQTQPSGDNRLAGIFNQSEQVLRTLQDWDNQRTNTDYERGKEQQEKAWQREDEVSKRNVALEREDRSDIQNRSRSDAVFAKNISQTNPFDTAVSDNARGAQLEGFLAAVDRTTRQSENLANYWSNKQQTEAEERIANKQMRSNERVASINNKNNWTKYRIDKEFDASLLSTLGNVYGQIPRR